MHKASFGAIGAPPIIMHLFPWDSGLPRIFSSIDAYAKEVIHLRLARTGHLPTWVTGFGDIGRPIPIPRHSKFFVTDPKTGVTLTGEPDEMTETGEGLWILDYKTAKFTGSQDALLPVYRAQLNGCALIAETLYQKPVVGLGLIYFEPVTYIGTAGGLIDAAGMSMGFKAKMRPIEQNIGMVPALITTAKVIYELNEPSAGRRGCRDCELLGDISTQFNEFQKKKTRLTCIMR